MADRIELAIEVKNLNEAKAGLEQVKAQIAALNSQKASIKFDLANVKAWKSEIQAALAVAKEAGDKLTIASLQKELAEAKERIQELRSQQADLNTKTAELTGTYHTATAAVKEQQSVVSQLRSDVIATEQAEKGQAEAAAKAAEEEARKAEEARHAAEEQARQAEFAELLARREAEAAAEAERMAAAAEHAEERFQALLGTINTISTVIGGVASAIDSVNSFGQGIFNVIGSAGDMFSSNIIDKALDTAISTITQKAMGDLDAVFERYDILNTFSPYMQLMGVSQAEADSALARINESILGLPIGLDEAAYRLRRYQMFIGDMERSTDFTIGIQRAILAGGASQSMQNQAYMQIERLLTTGELTTKRQWMSLLNGLGVSTQFIAEQLGYEGWTGKELAGALYTGTISAEEFLHAIEELGVGTSEAAKRLNTALEIQKGTIQSWLSNIDFAFTRGGANTLNAIDAMLQIETGVSITGYMEAFRNKVNEAYKEIQEWIYTNPESFQVTFDALDSLGESLSRFNLGKIATDALNHSTKFIEGISGAINKLDPDRTETFVSFAASVAKPIAQIAMKSGDFGLAMGVIEEFDDHDWGKIFEKIVENVNDIADTVSGILGAFPDEMLDGILAFSVTKGPLIVAGLNLISKALKNLGSVMSFLHEHPFVNMLSTAAIGWGIGMLIDRIAAAYGENAMNEIYDMDLITGGTGQSQTLASSIGQRQAQFAQMISNIDSQSIRMQDSLARIRELNKAAAEGDAAAVVSLSANVERYNALFPEFSLALDANTGLLDRNSAAIVRNADAYVEAYGKAEKAPLLTDRLAEIDEDIEAAKGQFKKQQELAAVAASYLDTQSQTALGSITGWKYMYNDLSYLREQYDDATQQTSDLKAKIADLNTERAGVMASLIGVYLGADAEVRYRTAANSLNNATNLSSELDEARINAERTTQTVVTYAQRLQRTLDEYGIKRSAYTLSWEDVDELFDMNLGEQFEHDLRKMLEYKDELPGLGAEYERLSEKQKTYTDITESASATIDELVAALNAEMEAASEAAEAQGDVASSAENVAAAIEAQQMAVESLVESYNELKNTSYEALHSALASFEEIKPPDKEYDFTGSVTANAKLTEQYYKSTLGFAQELLNLTSGNYDLTALPEGVTAEDLITFINDIRKTGDMHKLNQAWEEYESGGLAGLAGMYSSSLENAASASELNAFMDALQSDKISTLLAIFSGEVAIPEGIAAPFIDAIESLSQMYDRLVQYGYEPDQGFLRLLNPKQEEDAYDLLEQFQEGIEELFGINEDSDEDTVNGIWGTLNRIMQETIEEKMPGLVDAIHNSEKPVKEWNKSIETTADNQDEAAQNTDKHKSAIGDLEAAIGQAMDDLDAVKSSYADIANAANQAAEAVSSLAGAIAGVPALTVGIDIPTISPTVPAAALLGPTMVPYASGGYVEGAYYGYDSVPSILTPGEFVVRRRAAQALGRSFLENINRLDIPGAMDSLLKQALPLPGHFVAYNNSRSYDNHATVNQNIYTNNAAFTYRRASRFVGAL